MLEIDIYDIQLSNKDKISIFYNDELRGVAYGNLCPLNNKILFPIMIFSNNEFEQDYNFKYYNDKNDQEINPAHRVYPC